LAYGYFNTAAKWTTAKPTGTEIGPGTTVHLCGTITAAAGVTALTFQGGGAAGAPVTLLFESGAILTAPYWGAGGAIALGANSHVVVNGGSNGLIEATANGTNLPNQIDDTEGIVGNQTPNTATDVTVENVTLQNLYVHTCTLPVANCTDEHGQDAVGIDVWQSSDVVIQNNTVSNAKWGIRYSFEGGSYSNVAISGNTLSYVDHGVFATAGGGSGTFNSLSIEGNHVFHMEVWDDVGDQNHHDCFHVNSAAGATFDGVSLFDNTCITDPGANGNTCIFSFPDADSEGPLTIFNNVCDSSLSSTNFFADGDINLDNVGGTVVNNTLVHPMASVNGGTQPCGVGLRTADNTVQNNVFVYAALPEDLYVAQTGAPASIDHNDFSGTPLSWEMPTATYYSTLSSWTTATGYDAHSTTGNANLNASYVPQAGSAALDAGVNLTSLGIAALDVDAAGNPRPDGGAWTMGAFNGG
jgi:parallel beta-helix repeat protein